MKTLIIYDSVFGNTAKIAHAIFQGCNIHENVNTVRVQEFTSEKLQNIDLLIVGSPTRGFRPTPAIVDFLKKMPEKSLEGVRIASFDTRLSLDHCKSGFVRFIVRKGGYAANVILAQLLEKGGKPTLPPEGFWVTGEEGPLLESEMERAAKWASVISDVLNN
jgi:flavodoxin I